MALDLQRVTAASGIAYVLFVGIENLDIIEAPGLSSPVSEIARLYAEDRTKLVVTTVCGTLSLLFYLVFAAGLWARLRARETPGDAWSAVGLVGGIGGPLLAAVGQTAHVILVLRGADGGLSPDTTRTLYDLDLVAQTTAGFLIALFLLGMGVSALRTGALPRWLAGWAVALAPLNLAVSLIGFVPDESARAAIVVSLGLETIWVLAASVWLLLAGWAPAGSDTLAMTLARVMLGAVGVAAGISGIALLAAPGATGDYFAWGLAPAPLASLVGGLYVASSAVYLPAARSDWIRARVLVVGILSLAVPIFAATMAHLDVFDFGRLPAWTWAVLFGVFPVAAAATLAGQRAAAPPAGGQRLGSPARAVLGALGALLLALSIALWADPVGAEEYLPFAPPALSGRVLGGWTFLLAVLAGWSALRDRAREAELALWALVAAPAGALVAAARSGGDLEPAGRRAAYVAVLVAWLLAALAIAASSRLRTRAQERAASAPAAADR
jgi:hypothetical protein